MTLNWHTRAALDWLEALLEDRFDLHLKLFVPGSQAGLIVAMPGSQRVISTELDGAMYRRRDSNLPCTHWDPESEGWCPVLPGELAAPGVASLNSPLFEITADGAKVHFDIFGLVYWILSRSEEVRRTDLDKHERFPASASHAHKHSYLQRPVVDEWLNIFGQLISKVWPSTSLPSHRYSLRISHDVDAPSMYGFESWPNIGRMVASQVIKRGDFRAMITGPASKLGGRHRLHSRDPFNTFDWLMDASESAGMKSCFYFIAGATDYRFDPSYNIEAPAIVALISEIHRRGHEIGLHPSYNTFRAPEAIQREFIHLRRTLEDKGIEYARYGARMHYLRWSQPETLRALDAAGFAYDSTLGYADQAGFRCGTCFEYQAFDPTADAALKLRLRPLIAMETTVLSQEYMGIVDGRHGVEIVSSLARACSAVGGSFSLLWHNSSLVRKSDRETYLSTLNACISP
jgi:hypothetical protein